MIKNFEEMRKVDISGYLKERDGIKYLNWADCKALLHANGAEKVYFTPVTNEHGSSLFMSDEIFTDKQGVTNRCYETRIKVVIDDLEFEMQSPVMNGANPVKDNSMSQQRVWNSMTRSFVKGVAIYTGLGFDLWSSEEKSEENANYEDNLAIHNIYKIKQRIEEKMTAKIASGLTQDEVLKTIGRGITLKQWNEYMTYFDIINKIDKELSK